MTIEIPLNIIRLSAPFLPFFDILLGDSRRNLVLITSYGSKSGRMFSQGEGYLMNFNQSIKISSDEDDPVKAKDSVRVVTDRLGS